MAFNITINKDEKEKFLKIMALYPDYMYVNGIADEEHYNLIFLGEDIEKDCLLQEALMEHLDTVTIEENVGG
jgi:hypothetical protein